MELVVIFLELNQNLFVVINRNLFDYYLDFFK